MHSSLTRFFVMPYPSRVLALPFILALVLFFTVFYENPSSDLFLLVPAVFVLVLIYVFHHQIDQWWWRKYPPGLDQPMKQWLLRFVPFYRDLSPDDQQRYERRIGLFIRLKEYTLKGKKDIHVPEDLKLMTAAECIRMTWNRDDYLMEQYDQIILYRHPFPSPQYPELHTFELFSEDGVVIMSLEQLVNGFNRENGMFNLGLYAAASMFISINPRLYYPDVNHLDDDFFEEVFGLQVENIYRTLGFNWVNRLNLLIYCYFEYPRVFEKTKPDLYTALGACLSSSKSGV